MRLHEAGAVDAIIDVVGSFVLADELGAEAFYSSSLPLCRGTIETDHGTLPLPAPATANILEAVGAPTFYKDGDAELVTPTGAAIIGACAGVPVPRGPSGRRGLRRRDRRPALAQRDAHRRRDGGELVENGDAAAPGTAVLGGGSSRRRAGPSRATVAVIETNIDDMAPNLLADIPGRCSTPARWRRS